jgi:hypothetical protein
VTKFSEKGMAQELAALRKRIEHVEGLLSALVADMAIVKERLDALEVVKVPSPTVDPDEPQRPETE